MKKVLATVAGVIALTLVGACSPAVDTKDTSTTPVTASAVQPDNIRQEVREFKNSRDAVRPTAKPKVAMVTNTVSHHENHVNHLQLIKAEKFAKAKAAKVVKVKKRIHKPEITKHKVYKKKPVKKKKNYTGTKRVSLAGIAACIAKYESGGNPRAQNPHSSASGLFQFIDGTWNNFKGYARAMYAPVSVQLQKFYIIWDNGRGAHHWVVRHKCGW